MAHTTSKSMRWFVATVVWLVPSMSAASESVNDLMLRYTFEDRIAEQMSENCPAFDFDDNAFRIRYLKLDQQLSLMGSSLAAAGVRYPESAFSELRKDFAERHGFGPDISLNEFCAAAVREYEEKTAIGSMLKPVK